MVARIFKVRPKRLYWQVYIEAWQNSGMAQKTFCDEHSLNNKTFRRWKKMFEENGGYELKQLKKPPRKFVKKAPSSYRGKALQAFWAMHVEAWWWSGLTAASYCKAHRLNRTTLARWRDILMDQEGDINWRELVHPSARPEVKRKSVSTSAKTSAKNPAPVIEEVKAKTGQHNRRSFSLKEKRAIVLETELPNVTVSEVARRHKIVTSMLFRWRSQFDFIKLEKATLKTVDVIDRKTEHEFSDDFLQGLLPSTKGKMAVDLPDGRQVFVDEGSDPDEVRAYIAKKENPL